MRSYHNMAEMTSVESGKNIPLEPVSERVGNFSESLGISRIEQCLNSTDFDMIRVHSFTPHKTPISNLAYYSKKKRNNLCMKLDNDVSTKRRNPKVYECVAALSRESKTIRGSRLIFVTVSFKQSFIFTLQHGVKAPARAFADKLIKYGVTEPAVVVLESGRKPYLNHAHLVVLIGSKDNPGVDERYTAVLNVLNRFVDKRNGVVPQHDYTEMMPLVGVARDLFEIESETGDIGLPPETYEASLSHSHWLNTWLKRDVKYIHPDGSKGRVDCLCRRLPINLGVADYLSKEIVSRGEQTRRVAYINMQKLKAEERRLRERLAKES